MPQHEINLNTYYIRKSSIDEKDLVSNAQGPDNTSHNGLMTVDQKTKLDGIANNANNYVHPNNFTAVEEGLYKISVNTNGHVTSITPMELTTEYITDIEIVDIDITYEDETSETIQILKVREKGMVLTVTGSSFSSYEYNPLIYTGQVWIDWDDGVTEQYTGGQLQHTFVDSASTHKIAIIGEITSLGDYCFRNCTNLTSIELPNSITNLGHYCFMNCSSLTSIKLPNSVTDLGIACFANCTSLTSITLPNSVTSLENNCFSGCSNLISIEISNSVTSLGIQCFSNCTSLSSLILNWETSNTIITYSSNTWAKGMSSTTRFSIPQGTTDLYVAKGYPSDRLVER